MPINKAVKTLDYAIVYLLAEIELTIEKRNNVANTS